MQYNKKTKVYKNGITNSIICSDNIFKYKDDELQKHGDNILQFLDEAEQLTYSDRNIVESFYKCEYNTSIQDCLKLRKRLLDDELIELDVSDPPVIKIPSEPRSDSVKRAKDTIFDYILNNEWEYFFTFTIDPKLLDSSDYKEVCKKVNKWFQNMTNRYNLNYIAVPELHKSGAVHFHALGKGDNLCLTDSGTKLYKGVARPVRDDTARKKHLDITQGRIVYNLKNWRFGFSSVMPLEGDILNTAFYVTKYITKDVKKIFGRFFWHNRGLEKPKIVLSNVDFESVDSFEFNGFKYEFIGVDEDETKRNTAINAVCD